MEQVLFGGFYDLLHASTTEYNTLAGGANWTSIEFLRYTLVGTDGVIKNLRVKLSGDFTQGSYTFTLMLNGAPTALTLTITDPATSGSNMVNEIDVTGGDYVSLQCDPDGAPTPVYATWTSMFEGDTANESLILGTTGANTLHKTNTEYCPIMNSDTVLELGENNNRQVVSTAGTIKDFYVKLNTDPGNPPDAYRFTVRLNKATDADSPIVTIIANNTTGSDLVNELDVVAGDILTLMVEPLNAPLAAPYASWGMTFVADIDGESIVLGGCQNSADQVDTEYYSVTGRETISWTVNENEKYQLSQGCTLKKLYVLLSNPPSAGDSYDFTLRMAGAGSNVTVHIHDADTTGNSGALTDIIALDEYLDLESVPTSSPDAVDAYWGFVCYIAPPAPTGAGMGAKPPIMELLLAGVID